MIIYLDQNKWIELAKIANGIDSSDRGKKILDQFSAVSGPECLFPLCSVHYIEFSRIKDLERRKRLGRVMWNLSKGKTIAPYRDIVEHEIEIALVEIGINITPRKWTFIGDGIEFAFDIEFQSEILNTFKTIVNESALTGSEYFNIDPLCSKNLDAHRNNFFRHLSEIKERKYELEKSKWDDWLHAISMVDIIDPLNRVFQLHGLNVSIMDNLDIVQHRQFLMSMPTRKLDVHLHRQVLKNEQYRPKKSDLEDWGGIGVGSCYCDVVVCEKHFANLLQRDGYRLKARIETNLENVFANL
jgi:hypothetical protein